MQIKNLFKSRLKLEPGTRLTSFLFIATSIAIAAGILIAANMYYNIDTGEIVVEEIQRVARVLRATAGLVVGGTDLPSGVALEVATTSAVRLSGANQELRFTGGTSYYVGIKARTDLTTTTVYTLPGSYPAGSGYVLTSDTSGNLSWTQAGTGGIGDITQVGDCASGDCFTGTSGSTLWFKSGSYKGALTIASLSGNATYTLPAVPAGTYYFALTSGTLTSGRIPIVTGGYTIGDSAHLTFDTGNRILTIGSANNAGQLRLYSNNTNYVGFAATSSLGSTVTYYWPSAPTVAGRVLASDASGNLYWLDLAGAGYGDISAVGDCETGECFVYGGATGTTLWFKSGSYYGALTVASGFTGNATFTLPAVSPGTYYFALGTGSANTLAYWTGSNTLGNLSSGSAGQLLRSQGSGQPPTWTTATYPDTVLANQALYASSDNVITAGTLPVAAGGTGRTSWTQWGVVYADGSTSLTNTAAGSDYYILTGSGNAAPQWRSISQLVFASNGLTISGTATTTLKLGGTLSENTTIALGNYDMIFNLTGTGDFRVQDAGTDILVVRDDGVILYRNYPLAQTGKQVLREVIPILGFDLPFRCASACNTATTVSRTIEDYPFSSAETGATRVHKFIIRYADTGTTTPSTWIVWNETDSTTTATFTVPATNSDLSKGKVYITGNVSIPGAGKKWHLRLETPSGMTIQVYDIMLAAYDQLP